jgi:hypothetical protein
VQNPFSDCVKTRMNYRVNTTFFNPANSQFWIMIIIIVLPARRMKALIYLNYVSAEILYLLTGI